MILGNRKDSCVPSTTSATPDRIALLLAGGDGTRLQDLTRQIAGTPIPKQYCRLWHDSSLLQATLSRAELFTSPDRISVIVNRDHLHLANGQLSALPKSNILVQPANHDTGPGIVFALLKLESKYPDATVAVFPTDHFIDDDRAFVSNVLKATATISQLPDKIAILGITPDRPETGYGYIVPSNPLNSSERAYGVKSFVEKPNLPSARDLIARGGLWNTFVMVFKISRMLELVRELVPHHFAALSRLREFPDQASEIYQSIVRWNFSAQVLSRIPEHMIMHEVADVHWSDWGTPESIERTYKALNMIPFWNRTNSLTRPIRAAGNGTVGGGAPQTVLVGG